MLLLLTWCKRTGPIFAFVRGGNLSSYLAWQWSCKGNSFNKAEAAQRLLEFFESPLAELRQQSVTIQQCSGKRPPGPCPPPPLVAVSLMRSEWFHAGDFSRLRVRSIAASHLNLAVGILNLQSSDAVPKKKRLAGGEICRNKRDSPCERTLRHRKVRVRKGGGGYQGRKTVKTACDFCFGNKRRKRFFRSSGYK